jgi:hypothetical protein
MLIYAFFGDIINCHIWTYRSRPEHSQLSQGMGYGAENEPTETELCEVDDMTM